MANVAVPSAGVVAKKKKMDSSFFKKGIFTAFISGVAYGLYTAFMTLGMAKGVWADYFYASPAKSTSGIALSAFVVTYLLGSLGSALNDTCSGIWCVIIALVKGKFGDYVKTLNSRAGRILILCAIIGGPIASSAYVIGLQMAGSIAVPISALCPAVGAILGRIFYKQELNLRMIFGILICVVATFMIGSTTLGDTNKNAFWGIVIAFISAVGWGFEGCVGGYATCMVDFEISITIRQVTSGISNLIILLPLWSLLAGENITLGWRLAGEAISNWTIIFFIVSGFFAQYSYARWYKGNSMCGAALGMALNGMFSFWGPFCCWIIIGLIAGIDGYALAPIQWAAAIVMIIGIFFIAMNPLDLFRKKNTEEA
ncbi:MAG: hypothetical protein PUA82_06735 [Eubacteriales bacterium]|jgi:uncharacterized membrane protein|nr:hypothetical protein [Eubacteriales bacterium]